MAAPPEELNLDWITPSLAVGGAFPPSAIPALVGLGVSAVMDLRSEARDDPVGLERARIEFLHLPTEDHCALSLQDMDTGVAFAAPRLRNGRVLVQEELEAFCRQQGIAASVSTSAKENLGVAELLEQIHRLIPWDRKPPTSPPKLSNASRILSCDSGKTRRVNRSFCCRRSCASGSKSPIQSGALLTPRC